ncbi:IclR family transcriptional regulator [Roseiarcus fermentans]|uniref:IclR family transcriptional regulator n=1 Tax=Roseiarcus fermentans TaxID=1473586 RepID=A0A366F7G9_9HYPH|nr:IclR family transcriptional regulator [Roseiarcus fermentans]
MSSEGPPNAAAAIAPDRLQSQEPPRYVAPAVEKGLDVLELLASSAVPLSQRGIADRLGRSVPEVYRVLASLERRGYIARGADESYFLTMKLHQLAMEHPPVKRLVENAMALLNRLAAETIQGFHVCVLDGAEIQAIIQVDSPAPIGFRVRVGGRNSALRSASGRTLLAFQPPSARQWALAASGEFPARDRLIARIEAIAKVGYEYVVDDTLKGIIDVSFPILDYSGHAIAALTMPFLAAQAPVITLEEAAAMASETASRISESLGGRQPQTILPVRDPLSYAASP